MAGELRALSVTFNRWELEEPNGHEREEVLAALSLLLRSSLLLLEAIPPTGTLGPVRRHR